LRTGAISLAKCVVGVALFCAWLSPTASADLTFGSQGSGAGQMERPERVAVDASNGHLYVADRGNNRIDVFDSTGAFLRTFGWDVDATNPSTGFEMCTAASGHTCKRGSAGTGVGQFASPISVAVDGSGNVYVGTDNFHVQKFDSSSNFLLAFGSEGNGNGQFSSDDEPLAIGPGGAVYVGDSRRTGFVNGVDVYVSRVEKFDSGGIFLESVPLPVARRIKALAVDSVGNTYVSFDAAGGGVHKYNPSGTELSWIDPNAETNALGIDASDNLFAFQRVAGFPRPVIAEYNSSGVTLRRFGYGSIEENFSGIAPYHTATGDVFGSEAFHHQIHQVAFPPPGPIVVPGSATATAIGNTKATLRAEINPEGKATTYRFEYVDQQDFEAEGFANPESTPASAVGSDFNLHLAEATIGCQNPAELPPPVGCLSPETTYHFRVVAENADGESSDVGTPFITKPSLEIKAAWSTNVGFNAATLHASVNPLGVPATGYFEYVDDAKFKASGFAEAAKIPAVPGKAPLSFGSSESITSASTTLSSLSPATTYHYQIVASNQFVTFTGAAHTFTTFPLPVAVPPDSCANAQFRTGAGSFLPDCRAYEMVSPLDKNNGDAMVVSVSGISGLNQSSTDGEKLTYASLQSFGEPQGAPFTSQYLAERHPLGDAEEGWQTEAISAPQGLPVLGTSFSLLPQFKAFSPDLCSGWLRHTSDPPLAPGAPAGFANLYRRNNCTEPSSFEAITEIPPPVVKAGDYKPQLQSLSADGSHAVYQAADKLTSDASSKLNANGEPILQVYERSAAGSLHLVSVLPNGTASELENSAGTASGRGEEDGRDYAVVGAVSENGSRVYWTAATPKFAAPGTLYVRDKADQPQSKIAAGKCSEAAKACTYPVSGPVSTGNAQFWAASPNGSEALFTIVSGAQTGNLYRFDFASKTSTLIAGEVAGLLGASKDLSRTYLVSKENRAAGATAGKLNLYRYEGNAFSFIATLSATDVDNGGETYNPASKDPSKRTSRMSEDGLHVAFMSSAPPPNGYDNIDAASGEPDAEVYLYDASADGGAGKLLCISCNPSGERPSGRKIKAASNGQPDLWGAAQIPTWQTMLYPGRPLAEDGQRLFFESFEALIPRDTNGRQDVYEWEASGTGGCTEASPAFSQSASGCIHLISSGESPQDSGFIDASPDGHDVFFATGSSLLVQDFGLVDVYDARVDGGFPPPPSQKPNCEGEACQSAPPPPADVTPASGAIEGPSGNVPPAKHHTKPRCGKGKRAGKRATPRHRKAHCRKRNHKGRAGR
jgi:hypothetical protein